MTPPGSESDALPSATLEAVRLRSLLLEAVRSFFRARGYWEVETPVLSQDVCVDRWLEPIELPASEAGPRRYLQTSPEFAMKRLLVAGAQAIFQLARAFRAGERGDRHNPEFTLLEWYRAGDHYFGQMLLVEELVRALEQWRFESCDRRPRHSLPLHISRLTYDQAFQQAIGARPSELDAAQLERLAQDLHIAAARPPNEDRDGWLNLLLAERVEPWLAAQQAVFVYDYPATQAALSEVHAGPPAVARRFELYLDGIEICNGYQELTDEQELARRMTAQSALREQAGLKALPVDSRLRTAMKLGLPACSGVALGFDRLMMWRFGYPSIDDVVAFPMERA